MMLKDSEVPYQGKRVWIDLANAPHAVFFSSLRDRLTLLGIETAFTIRNFNSTAELSARYGISGQIIGTHGGKSGVRKVANISKRCTDLVRYARPQGFSLALSHNSYSQVLAARMLGIRTVTLMDYEGQPANHLAFRAAHKVIVPESFPDNALKRFGAGTRKVWKYPGFKEQIYLSDFKPDPAFDADLKKACGLPETWDSSKTILVTVRTPPTMAAYHRFENPLFDALMSRLNMDPNLTVIALPRDPAQKERLAATYPNIRIPGYALDGRNLLNSSDVVISAGGTMNREAAVLGTPAYTVFAGEFPAVDARLVEMGRMKRIRSTSDIASIRLEKNNARDPLVNKTLCQDMVNEILS